MKAVIFDMDGVIVDSEKLWSQAEREVFGSLGVQVTNDLSILTQNMTTTEVTKFWYERFPWVHKSQEEVEQMVIDRVIELIEKEDCVISGIKNFMEKITKEGFKIGVATNSPYSVIPAVLRKANISHLVDAISSAEFEENGKPQPDVYLNALKKLNLTADQCIAIEDSNSGIRAAKTAGLKVIAFSKYSSMIVEETYLEVQSFEDIDFKLLPSSSPART